MNGKCQRADNSNASRVKSYDSWASAGSSIGTAAATAKRRLSCSFWLDAMPGSSAETITSGPLVPV